MKLIQLLNEIRKGGSPDDLMTVYAKREWTSDSEAIIILQPEDNSTSPIDGYEYFLEVFIIKDWMNEMDSPEVTLEQCNRIIHYAVHDA